MRILRGLTSRVLPCGCVAGVYETYDGKVVTLIDERQATCADPNHIDGEPIPELTGSSRSKAASPRDTRRS
jgi:hypothetical protein